MQKSPYLVFLIMLTFFVISFLSNIMGPLIPDIIQGFQLNLMLVALLPFAFFIAYGIMSIPAGMFLEVYQEKKVMVFAFGLACLGSLLMVIFPNYLSAILSLFLIGCGMAMLQVVINPLLRTAGGEEHYAFYSVMGQLTFGFASFLSPMVYQYFLSQKKLARTESNWMSAIFAYLPENLSWISLYFLFVVICIGMIGVIYVSKFPQVELQEDEKAGPLATHIELFKNKYVLLYFFAMLCYVGTEQGVANWISQFLATYHQVDPQTIGADTVAYFWGLMTAGGILGLVLLKIMDSRWVLSSFTLLAMISLGFALWGPVGYALVAFPLVGFFASVIYPVIFSLALNSVDKHHGSFSGIIVTGIIGGAIVPFLVGWIGDHWGLQTGMGILFISLAYIFSIGFWAKPIIQNKRIQLFD
jgi:FHS family L-fucose permease-like MFS transporter